MTRYTPWMIGGLVFLLAYLFSLLFQNNERLRHDVVMQEAAQRIEQRIENQISALYAVRGLFVSSDKVTRAEFQNFLQSLSLERRGSGAQGFGYALAQGLPDTGDAKRWVKEYYHRSIEPWPKTNQKIRFPIVFLEPADRRNLAALNYDMYTDSIRREAMQIAWAERRAAITRPVTLVQEIDDDKQVGFLIYLPFFEDEENIARLVPTERRIKGFIYAPFRAGDLFTAILNEKPKLNIDIQAYSESIDAKNLLYRSTAEIQAPSVHKISVAGRDWVLRIKDKKPAAASLLGLGAPSRLVMFFGLLLAIASGALAKAQIDRIANMRKIAAAGEERAKEKELLLREMAHRMKNGIARISSIANLSAAGVTDVKDYVKIFTSRLSSMADAQDLLAESGWQSTTIRELVSLEIQQLASIDQRNLSISGPAIHIDSEQSQALGLVIHELATNSAKYGAFLNNGMLNICWSLDEKTDPKAVHFQWEETGLNGTPNFSSAGFGTKIITLMVEGNLSGKISRHGSPGRALIKLEFPIANFDQ